MNSLPLEAVAAIGDAGDPRTWSGIPWHFGQAAAAAGTPLAPWRLDLAPFAWPRRWWNAGRLLRGRRPGGYQFSPEFLAAAEATIPAALQAGRVLSFNQFFPRARTLARHGGRLHLYLDATLPRLLERYGLAGEMDRRTAAAALAAERENLAAAETIFAFQQWTADSLVQECGVDPARVRVVLPGANLPPGLEPGPPPPRAAGRPLVLGFVGKDWRRKNLPFLVEVAHQLGLLGVPAEVHCAGGCPPELQRDPVVRWAGFLDKQRDPAGFILFLQGCDLGCLFSRAEASSIAALEFLGAGVPVAGFVVDGMGDLLLPGASLRFAPGTGAAAVATRIAEMAADPARRAALAAGAAATQDRVSWARCVREIGAALAAPQPEVAVG